MYSAEFHFLTEGRTDWRKVLSAPPGSVDGLQRGRVRKRTPNGSEVASPRSHPHTGKQAMRGQAGRTRAEPVRGWVKKSCCEPVSSEILLDSGKDREEAIGCQSLGIRE